MTQDFRPPDATPIEPTSFRPPRPSAGWTWPALPWAALLASAAVGLTLVVIAYLAFARSVALNAAPAHAALSVRGVFAPRIGSHWLLIPGAHRVHAQADGYKPFDEQITVTSATLQAHTITLTPLPGRLTLTLNPSTEASVWVDGELAGTAPGTLDAIEAGPREVRVEAPRYLPFLTKLVVRGQGQEETLEVNLTPAWADFRIASQPTGAQVTVDGKLLGATPLGAELLHGERKLTLTRPGYKPWSRVLKVVAGRALDVAEVTLSKADGWLEIVTEPRGAAVTVDGRYRGESPVKVPVAPDAGHRVTAMKAGYEPQSASAQVAPDDTTNLALQLAPELAVINLITLPADAELVLDGQPAGNATQRLNLPTFEHEIVVRRAGYATYRTLITPRKGVDKHLRITLKTAAEMATELTPPTPEPVPAAPSAAPSQLPPPLSEADQQAALVMAQIVPPAALAALAALAAGDRLAPRSPPSPATAGQLRTALGQSLLRVNGGDLVLPGRPPARLARPFYLATREVTNAQYQRYMALHQVGATAAPEVSNAQLPVVLVSWEAAAQYCNWLSRLDALPVFYQIKYGRVLGIHPEAVGYRLPTEAEWDWATAVTATGAAQEYPWGGGFPPPARSGNFADRAAGSSQNEVLEGYDDGFASAAPVGSFPPNAQGFYDLAGNVAEWVHDTFAPTPAAGLDPLGPPLAAQHVVRGSSWAQAERAKLRALARSPGVGGRPDLGFRIARYAQ
ncbi:MAG: PEGA domain-containing protein [Gammaproteobacteria bacterium]|nr:PEGA domain-containing protein [Gammaproteobacteria bacterium]